MKFLPLAAAALAPAVMAQGFQTSCRDIKAVNQYLSAICQTSAGTEVCTEIDLSNCLLNVNGRLTYANDVAPGTGYSFIDEKSGQFTRTGCTGCSSSGGSSTVIRCDSCPNGRTSTSQPSSFDLSSVVGNKDGYLTCLREKGRVKDISYCEGRAA